MFKASICILSGVYSYEFKWNLYLSSEFSPILYHAPLVPNYQAYPKIVIKDVNKILLSAVLNHNDAKLVSTPCPKKYLYNVRFLDLEIMKCFITR